MYTQKPRRWLMAFLWGGLLEVVAIFLGFALPDNSWLFSKIVWLHNPLLSLFERVCDPLGAKLADLVFLLGVPLTMVIVWAIAIRTLAFLFAWVKPRIPPLNGRRFRWSFGIFAAILLMMSIYFSRAAGPRGFTKSAEVSSVVDGNTSFALALYKQLQPRNGNLFFSPYNISAALAMTYAGSAGQTESEMASTLHFNLPQDKLHPAFGALEARLKDVQRNHIKLTTANALWLQQGYTFTQSYLDLVHLHYKAAADIIDFKKSPIKASAEINGWIEQKTDGKIKGLITPNQITPSLELVLASTIYFKGNWKAQFEPSATRDQSFFLNDERTVDVPMMSQTAEFKMHRNSDDKLQLIELPYVGMDLSMIVLLPERHDGLTELETGLTLTNLTRWLAELDSEKSAKTVVVLPRFKTTQGVNLKQELATLGMPSLFDPEKANLSRLDTSNMLFISEAIHQAYVEVNEEGTEAAAATVQFAKTRSMTRRFRADHPFIFLIRDNGSGNVLFLGRIVNPSNS